jgi:hypothetical protein
MGLQSKATCRDIMYTHRFVAQCHCTTSSSCVFVCACVCMCVCACVCMCVHVCACVCACVCVHVCLHVCYTRVVLLCVVPCHALSCGRVLRMCIVHRIVRCAGACDVTLALSCRVVLQGTPQTCCFMKHLARARALDLDRKLKLRGGSMSPTRHREIPVSSLRRARGQPATRPPPPTENSDSLFAWG